MFRGVSLEKRKKASCTQLKTLTLPETVSVLLPKDASEEDVLVSSGDDTVRFQPLFLPQDGSIPVFSPVAGVVERFGRTTHPLCGEKIFICISTTSVQKTVRILPVVQSGEVEPDVIRKAAGQFGILDELDSVPLHEKLRKAAENPPEILFAAAYDDDSYSSAEAASLCFGAEAALDGLRLAAAACGAKEIRIVTPKSVFQKAFDGKQKELWLSPGKKYPVAPNLLKKHQKFELIGVQALIALSRAVREGNPQTDTVVSVAGECVKTPKNFRVPIGTPMLDVLRECQLKTEPALVVVGHAVTGKTVSTLSCSVTAGTRCILALPEMPKRVEFSCIGCANCAGVCPEGIVPWLVLKTVRQKKPVLRNLSGVENCVGCKACVTVCPAGIDLSGMVARAAKLKKEGNA